MRRAVLVYATPDLCSLLRQQGKDLGADQELQVTGVFDSGAIGGIVCRIAERNADVFVVSLTHLCLRSDHPLKEPIAAYQNARVRSLSR